jgi:hypothetical protein
MTNGWRHAEWAHFKSHNNAVCYRQNTGLGTYRGISYVQVVTLISRFPFPRPLILITVTPVTGSVWIGPLHCTKVKISISIGHRVSNLHVLRSKANTRYCWSRVLRYTPHTAREFPHPQLSGGSISPTRLPFSFLSFAQQARLLWASYMLRTPPPPQSLNH